MKCRAVVVPWASRRAPWAIAAVVISALAATGCKVDVSYAGTTYRCDDGQTCPSGFQCVAGVCQSGSQAVADARPADAHSATDAAVDAASPPDAPGQPDANLAPDAMLGNPGTHTLTDNFDDGVQGPQWPGSYQDPGTTHLEKAGVLALLLPNGVTNAYCGYQTLAKYDFREDYVLMEVLTVPPSSSGTDAYVEIILDGSNSVSALYESGRVYLQKYVAGTSTDVGSVSYQASNMRYWRLREHGGRTFFDTSPDGITYSTRLSMNDPGTFDYSGVQVGVGAGVWQSETTAGVFTVDNFNLSP